MIFFSLHRKYLTSSTFLRLQSISGYPGHVNTMSLFNYTMRKVWLQQTRIGLSLYDFTGQGFLRESVNNLETLRKLTQQLISV